MERSSLRHALREESARVSDEAAAHIVRRTRTALEDLKQAEIAFVEKSYGWAMYDTRGLGRKSLVSTLAVMRIAAASALACAAFIGSGYALATGLPIPDNFQLYAAIGGGMAATIIKIVASLA